MIKKFAYRFHDKFIVIQDAMVLNSKNDDAFDAYTAT